MDWDKEIENLKKSQFFRINFLMKKLVECTDVQEATLRKL